MFYGALIVAWTAFQSGAAFEIDLWPGEGRPVFEATASRLTIHLQPRITSPVVRILEVRPRDRLVFDSTRFRTMAPGAFVARQPTEIAGRDLGDIQTLTRSDYYSNTAARTTIRVLEGDSVMYLQDRAEGTCFLRIRGSVIEADRCPSQQRAEFRAEREPRTEWWIRVLVDGTPIGWLLVTDTTARVVRRLG